jgi:hypothetical protein
MRTDWVMAAPSRCEMEHLAAQMGEGRTKRPIR